jgi:hypothetical protein
MRLDHFRHSLIACIVLSVAFAMTAVDYVRDTFTHYVLDPLADYFTAEPVGLQHAELRHASIAVGGPISRERVVSFESRRQARIVGSPASAFDLAVPRQGGLIAA